MCMSTIVTFATWDYRGSRNQAKYTISGFRREVVKLRKNFFLGFVVFVCRFLFMLSLMSCLSSCAISFFVVKLAIK